MLPDQSLQVREFAPIVEKQPINVHYQRYTADSFSTSSVSWNVDAPYAGALLDNELLITYTVQITGAAAEDVRGMWEGQVVNGVVGAAANEAAARAASRNDNRLALSEGFSIANCLQSCNVTINGQTLTQSPRKWMGEFMRFYASPHEERTICSLSGGEMDDGDHSSTAKDEGFAVAQEHIVAAGATNFRTMQGYSRSSVNGDGGGTAAQSHNLRPQFPKESDAWYNGGFTKRCYKLARHARTLVSGGAAPNAVAGNDNAGNRYSDAVLFEVTERLPMSPFLLWEAKDGRHSLPYVDKMEIDLRFTDAVGLRGYGLQGHGGAPVLSFLGAGTVAPVLHLKWYIPPMGMVMQPQVSIPIQKIKEYSSLVAGGVVTTIAAGQDISNVQDTTVSNVRLQQIPDLFFIYAKPTQQAQTLQDPLEKHLEIQELRITVNGDSGKVLQASSARLFSLYVKNAPMAREREYDYETWRKRYCTAVLTPADLGVLMPPGINHGVTLDVEIKTASHWSFPRVGLRGDNSFDAAGVQYEIHILSVYDKYELTLTNRGNAQLKLLNVPSPAVAQGIAQPDQADLAQAFA